MIGGAGGAGRAVDEAAGTSRAGPPRKNPVFELSLVSALLFVPLGVHLPYFPVWLAARGLSDFEIAAALATPMILRVAVTPTIAAFADRRGVGVSLTVCAGLLLVSYCGLCLARGFPAVFAGAVLAALALGAMPALADALTLAEISRIETPRQPHGYGRFRAFVSLGVLVMMLLSSPIVAAFPGPRIIFALAGLSLAPLAVSILAAARMNPRPRVAARKGGRLTPDAARLRVALATIAAGALIQSSHAQLYSFATIHWRAAGLSPGFISLAWAAGVACEAALFLISAPHVRTQRAASVFLLLGGAGAALRWTAMSFAPVPAVVLLLQTTHALSFGATTVGVVVTLGGLASPTHGARMQGWLAAATSLSLAAATFLSGRLTPLFGERSYLAMAALAAAGLAAALLARALGRRLES